ncbi:unnamed protein product [Ectocarpus sp. 12 AP-2014]
MTRVKGLNIVELRRLEADLKNKDDCATSWVERDAMVKLLKYLQVQTVEQFERAYDDLHFELAKDGGLECVRSITPARSKDFFQPKVLELQDCDEDAKLPRQLQFFLEGAKLTKPSWMSSSSKRSVAGRGAKFDAWVSSHGKAPNARPRSPMAATPERLPTWLVCQWSATSRRISSRHS